MPGDAGSLSSFLPPPHTHPGPPTIFRPLTQARSGDPPKAERDTQSQVARRHRWTSPPRPSFPHAPPLRSRAGSPASAPEASPAAGRRRRRRWRWRGLRPLRLPSRLRHPGRARARHRPPPQHLPQGAPPRRGRGGRRRRRRRRRRPPPRPHFLLPGDSTGPSTGKGTETGKGTGTETETETETETGTGSCGGILPLPVLLAEREAAGGTGRRVRPPHWRRPQPLGLPVPGLAPSTSSELSLPPPPPPAREGEGTEGAGAGKETGAGKASASASARFPALSCPAAAAIGTHLRRYAEHASATRFHWSYLGSTGIPPEGQVPRGGSAAAAAAEASAGGRRGGGTEAGAAPRVTDPLTAHAAPSTPAVSTISLAFSPDGATLASTHGDHTVKITCALTGRLIRSLEGHPRTPWTVKYHPTQPNIVASGCLGFQVRVWDWNYRPAAAAAAAALGRGGEGPPMGGAGGLQQQQQQQGRRSGSPRTVGQPDPAAGTREVRPHPHLPPARPDHDVLPPRLAGGAPEPHRHDYHLSRGVCLSMIRLQFAIISLSFHPTGHVLACASGSKVHLWDWDDRAGRERREWEEEIRVGGREGETGTGGAPPPSKASAAAAAAASSLALPPSSGAAPQERQIGGSGGQIGEYSFPHALRCVHFPPSGRHLIIGGANPGHGQQGGGMSGGGMTFCLRLWDFDLGAALHPRGAARPGAGGGGRGGRSRSRSRSRSTRTWRRRRGTGRPSPHLGLLPGRSRRGGQEECPRESPNPHGQGPPLQRRGVRRLGGRDAHVRMRRVLPRGRRGRHIRLRSCGGRGAGGRSVLQRGGRGTGGGALSRRARRRGRRRVREGGGRGAGWSHAIPHLLLSAPGGGNGRRLPGPERATRVRAEQPDDAPAGSFAAGDDATKPAGEALLQRDGRRGTPTAAAAATAASASLKAPIAV